MSLVCEGYWEIFAYRSSLVRVAFVEKNEWDLLGRMLVVEISLL